MASAWDISYVLVSVRMAGLLRSEGEVPDSSDHYHVPAIICDGYYEAHFTAKETKAQTA